MTRYTNVGWKRAYHQGSFDNQIVRSTPSTPVPGSSHAAATSHAEFESTIDTPAESNRKRRRTSKADSGKVAADSTPAAIASDEDKTGSPVAEKKRMKVLAGRPNLKPMTKENKRRAKTIADRATSTEARRLKRMAGRHAHMTCFACRQVGHSAKDCTTIRPDADREGSGTTITKTNAESTAIAVVGICYRCGSRKHNLARCWQPVQPDNPLPYASCFVCSGSGHLASSCPQNNGKGVYPNGGSCKLCGETTHLARDCTLRRIDGGAIATLLGTGREAGADEDDFHTIRQKNAEMDREDHGEERARKKAKVRVGAFTGVVKAFGKTPVKSKKVVNF